MAAPVIIDTPAEREARPSAPGGLAGALWRAAQLRDVVCDRLRAAWWRGVRGAAIAPKCRIGARVRLDRSWNITLGTRVTLESDVWFKLDADRARVEVGEQTFLGRGTELDISEELVIGRHVLIAPGVFITDHNHRIEAGTLISQQGCVSRPVAVGDDVWIGARSVILAGVTIGRGAVVGAGAVVARDVPENTIVAGVPARVIRHRDESPAPFRV